MNDRLVGVRAGWSAPLGFCETDEPDLRAGEDVVMERDGRVSLGKVVITAEQLIGTERPVSPLGRIRRATAEEARSLRASVETEGARLFRTLP